MRHETVLVITHRKGKLVYLGRCKDCVWDGEDRENQTEAHLDIKIHESNIKTDDWSTVTEWLSR